MNNLFYRSSLNWNNYYTHSNSTIRLWDKFDKHSLVFAVVGWVGFEHKIEPSGPVPRRLKFHPPISSGPVCSQEPKYWNRGSQPPEESEERTSLGRLYTSHLEGQNAKEEGRDVQVKRKGDIQIKYPSLLHSMHRTNSASRINGRMTPEQCSHNLQHILPPPTKLWWDENIKEDHWLYKWRVEMHLK